MMASAVVCTRNRPDSVVRAARSILAVRDEPLELIVMDQSDDDSTERALAEFRADPRFSYHLSKARGKGAALNEGLKLAKQAIVVCTDDDCEVPPGWVTDMARVLESEPSAVVLFCNVVAVEHDATKGYVPTYTVPRNRLLRSISAICGGLGIGAGMAVRRDFALSVGGFDESFGPGARFPSADEWDLAMRALLSGKHVYETTELSLLHDGFRTFEEGRVHARRDWIALGAVCAKPLRAGYLSAAVVPVWLFGTRALLPPVMDALHFRRPRGVVRVTAFLRGFVEGFRTPVDAETLCFTRK